MIVLDASFIKLVLEEENSSFAEEYFRKWVNIGEEIALISIALPEVLNTLWRHHMLFGDIDLDSLRETLSDLLILWGKLKIYSMEHVVERVLEIAINEHIPIHDILYIALAEKYSGLLASFDKKQCSVARKVGVKTIC